MVATEIAILPLKSSFDPNDKTSDNGKAQTEGYKLISKAPGFQDSWYGATVENDKELLMIINWDSISSHISFTKSPEYPELGKYLSQTLGGAPSYIHFSFTSQSELKDALAQPVTENVTAYFSAVDKAFEEKLDQFRKVVEGDAAGAKGFAYGWGEEEVEHEKIGEGKKGRVLKLLIGWESVEAHMKFRETEVFKENVGLLRDGPVALTMSHVKARPQSEAI
ncbi:hypothetical protein BDZ85DRAFT_295488 [Elsinoe ampelina]|uniref:ABM domain-containing protein n=1 Tax=Elsinoe ampelina TaxID=302913 RepID=A0A6A6GG94_9PEZI|nr:hypothetical protein BDZ85DRAFT_295488 [Elsinoe ampelina]